MILEGASFWHIPYASACIHCNGIVKFSVVDNELCLMNVALQMTCAIADKKRLGHAPRFSSYLSCYCVICISYVIIVRDMFIRTRSSGPSLG